MTDSRYREHGISIGMSRSEDSFYIYLKPFGKLSHDDYQTITPMLERAMESVDARHTKMLIDAREFEGWEARAAWDDFKLGLVHGKVFSHLAIVGNKPWEKLVAKLADWILTGECEFFENYQDALDWLNNSN